MTLSEGPFLKDIVEDARREEVKRNRYLGRVLGRINDNAHSLLNMVEAMTGEEVDESFVALDQALQDLLDKCAPVE